MSSQHNKDKLSIRADADTVSGLLIDAGLVTLGEELRDLLHAANHCEIALRKHRTSEAFYLSAEAHRVLNVRTDKARKTMFELASMAIREGEGAVYFAGNSWAPEKAIGFARRMIACAERAIEYTKRARKMTMIGVAAQATDRVVPVQIVTVN